MIDCYSVKPIDAETLAAAAEETGRSSRSRITGPRAGSARRCSSALAERASRRAGRRSWRSREMPRSGKPAELLAASGIDAAAIAATASAVARYEILGT